MRFSITRFSVIQQLPSLSFFTAYDLFKGRNDPESTMPMWLLIAFMVFFALAGAALLVFAIRLWVHSKDEEQQEEKEDKMR